MTKAADGRPVWRRACARCPLTGPDLRQHRRVLPSQVLTSLGLLLDLLGGTLLAVEAIRLPNLILLRDQVLPNARLFFESPRLYFDEEPSAAELERNQRRGFGHRNSWYVAFHFVTAIGAVALLEVARLQLGIGPSQLLAAWIWDWETNWRWLVLAASGCVLVLGLPFTLGCWVHRSAERLLEAFVAVLIRIERGTPSGATGITGAVLFATGFLLQLIAVWV